MTVRALPGAWKSKPPFGTRPDPAWPLWNGCVSFWAFYQMMPGVEQDLVQIAGPTPFKNQLKLSDSTVTVDGRGVGGACVGFSQSGYCEVASSSDYDLATGTLSFWYRTSQPIDPHAVHFWGRVDSFASHNGMMVFADTATNNPITADFDFSTTNLLLLAGPPASDGRWHHVAVVFRQALGGVCRLYVGGVLVTSGAIGSSSWSFNGQPLRW